MVLDPAGITRGGCQPRSSWGQRCLSKEKQNEVKAVSQVLYRNLTEDCSLGTFSGETALRGRRSWLVYMNFLAGKYCSHVCVCVAKSCLTLSDPGL